MPSIKKVTILLAAAVAGMAIAAAAWTLAASYLFVWLAGLANHFPHPWTTWWLYAGRQNPDRWTKLYLGISAGISAIPLAVVAGFIVWALLPSKKNSRDRRRARSDRLSLV